MFMLFFHPSILNRQLMPVTALLVFCVNLALCISALSLAQLMCCATIKIMDFNVIVGRQDTCKQQLTC